MQKIPKFADVFTENSNTLSECEDHRVAISHLLWYIYRKCDYDILEFKDALETITCGESLTVASKNGD